MKSNSRITKIRPTRENQNKNIQYINGLPDQIKIDRNLYVVSSDVTNPGLYVGSDFLVEKKMISRFCLSILFVTGVFIFLGLVQTVPASLRQGRGGIGVVSGRAPFRAAEHISRTT